jgi:hypothetical protein
MPSSVARYHDPNAEAKLLLGFVAVALVAGTGYICYSRLHVRKEQLMEASLYILAWSFVFWDLLRYVLTAPTEKENAWPHPPLRISRRQDNLALQKAFAADAIVIGYDIHQKPVLWPDEVRVMQANGFGMTGAGKTTLLLNIIQQDLVRETGPKGNRHKIPLIIIDGKGEREFLDDKLLPLIAAAGRLDDLRIIDPARPEISVRFNPFIAITGQYQEHVSFIFESFDLREDFFHGHQKTYLSDIVRILYYTGKRYNIYDILVMAYDLEVLKEQAKIASSRIEKLPDVSHQQRLNFQMSVRNLIESFGDPKRVQMIRGLINQMMTFLEDKLSIITGPYEDLISIEDVIEKGQILFVSLNTNKNDDTTRALGRMILQNLQLVIGERYERKRADMYMPFVSVIMDEFAPIAYSNFANILQTARGSNTAFLFAMQSIPQLLSVGKAFQHDVASAPNTTFMLRTRDEDTAQYFLNASARVRQLRRSMSIRKKGIFNPSYEDQGVGSQTEVKDTRSQEEHIKNLPVGQMEYLMSDKRFGTIHGHAHVRVAPVDRLSSVVPEILPRYASLYNPEIGANLRFRDVTLEASRKRGMRNRRREGAEL